MGLRIPHLEPKQVRGGMRTWSLKRRPEGTSLSNPANEDREGSAVCQLVRVGKGEN